MQRLKEEHNMNFKTWFTEHLGNHHCVWCNINPATQTHKPASKEYFTVCSTLQWFFSSL